jgi:hypothetical protein
MVTFQIEMAIVVLSAGCCIWESAVFDKVSAVTYVQLALAITYYLLPLDDIFMPLFRDDPVYTMKGYDEARKSFWEDYDRRNPITMQKAIEDWVDGDDDDEDKKATKK